MRQRSYPQITQITQNGKEKAESRKLKAGVRRQEVET